VKKLFRATPDWVSAQPQMREWYASLLGQSMLHVLDEQLAEMLPRVFGYQALQLGQIAPDVDLLRNAGMLRRIVLDPEPIAGAVQIGAQAQELPIASGCVNLLLMPHTLEFCADPHQALREANRVLTADGHLLVLGFNPWSAWGVKRALLSWREYAPWNGYFHGSARISDWLSLLNFRILRRRHFYMRLPVANQRLIELTRFMDKTTPVLGLLGGAYLIHARKQTMPVTPVRNLVWRPRRASVVSGHFARHSNKRRTHE
jgi:SAM-dependent methyltransferase